MGALHGLPGARLGLAELGLLGGVPADRGRVEQDLGALQGGEAGGLGVPLVPADERADLCEARGEGLEPEVAGGEVVFLVIERVVGDVHLAVDAAERAVGVEDDGRVVVDARRPPLEDRADDDDAGLAGDLRERLGRRAGDGLGEVEVGGVLGLAEVLGAEQFGEADDLRPRPPASRTPSRRGGGCRRGRSSTASGPGRR